MSVSILKIFLVLLGFPSVQSQISGKIWTATDVPPRGLFCSPYSGVNRVLFRQVQQAIMKIGWQDAFMQWDGLDDTVPDSFLSWSELTLGLANIVIYDSWGSIVTLASSDIRILLREFSDDTTEAFRSSQWGSSFYSTDGKDQAVLAKHNAGRPQNQADGASDNAMCKTVDGVDLGFCEHISPERFRSAIYQIADIKYAESCNGHGICEPSLAVCLCDAGWSGFNCSDPEIPCSGLTVVQESHGSISPGFGRDRDYGSNLNCSWLLMPDIAQQYGLPMLLVFTFIQTEDAYDTIAIFGGIWEDPNQAIINLDGIFPKISKSAGAGTNYGLPQTIVVDNDVGATVQFTSDASIVFPGFRMMFGTPLSTTMFQALQNPLLAPGCQRKLAANGSACYDDVCSNCGLTLNELADGASNGDILDNMCYISSQSSTVNTTSVKSEYLPCADILLGSVKYQAGDTITLNTPCPSGTSFTSLVDGVELDAPEYILGPGPPQYKPGLPEEGQAHQRGYIVPDWWSSCDTACLDYRATRKYDLVYEDQPGSPGPIFGALLMAKNSSIASKLQGPWETFPPLIYTNLLYGYPQGMEDVRTWNEKNSFALRDLYNATFFRCRKHTIPSCQLGQETCSVTFTPTKPGIYLVDFFKLSKRMNIDAFMQATPFPIDNLERTVVVLPAATSPGHSMAHGDGLDYAFTTRAGVWATFWIEALDRFGNPKLGGEDQFVVVMVSDSARQTLLADVMNVGNGSYVVGYNVTTSGRYSMSIVMKYGTSASKGEVTCQSPGMITLLDGQYFDDGSRWCHVGSERDQFFRDSLGKLWCPPGSISCISYSLATPDGLPPIPPASPYSIFVASGPLGTDTIQAFGTGLTRAIAGYSAIFYLRMRDIFGNWVFRNENITFAFDVPHISQHLSNNDTSPQNAGMIFAGNENWLGDYMIEWFPIFDGDHYLSVMLCTPFCLHIVGSPFQARVQPSPTYGPTSIVQGSGIQDGVVGEIRNILIQDRDLRSNDRKIGGANFRLQATGLSLADCPQIQDSVLRDVSCKCNGLYLLNISQCYTLPKQLQPGSELSLNIPPELTCLYRRNEIECPSGCCPDGIDGDCSVFSLPSTNGQSAYASTCIQRACASPEECKIATKALRLLPPTNNSLFKTFLENARLGCPQLERLGLEAGFLLPPNDDKGTYFLDTNNLDPTRQSWRGPLSLQEVMTWISTNLKNLAMLYYTRARNVKGYYFTEYDAATANKSNIEGYVFEQADIDGSRVTRTSIGPTTDGVDAEFPTMVADIVAIDNDDGTYNLIYNITRAGLYRISVSYQDLEVSRSPFNVIIEPEQFDAPKCIVNGTGAAIDTNTHTGESDYKGAIVAGLFVSFDIRLRDKYWNYLWKSVPISQFRIFLDPMRVRYFDTALFTENEVIWSAGFQKISLQTYGDANYAIDYTITTAGNFPLNIELLDAGTPIALDKSPYMIAVRPDIVDVPSSTAFGLGLFSCGAGTICSFAVETRDRWGNRRVLSEDEGPWCHAWNPTVNNGGSGGNQYASLFDPQGCATSEACLLAWTQFISTQPASPPVFNSRLTALPATSNGVAYQARGGVLHDCIPQEPFKDPTQYYKQPSCVTTNLGPCGQYDSYGRINEPIWIGTDGGEYTWASYVANFPELRGRYFVLIPNAQPVQTQNFSCFVDGQNFYTCTYNITKAGIYDISVVYYNRTGNVLYHISGSPFSLVVSGGITTPHTCIVTGQGASSALVGYPGTFTVHARDSFNNFRTLGREKVEVYIQGTELVRPIPAKILDHLNGSYYVEYNATLSGTYSMSVSILDQDIPGSPFIIRVQKGINLPHFNTTWGLTLVGNATQVVLQGANECYDGKTGCVSAISLAPSIKNSTGALWYNTKQRVVLGFETTFCFRMESGLDQHCQTAVVNEATCMYRGGDGFAFVIHDNGFYAALGTNGGGIGYGAIDNSIAIEFDTWYNAFLGDVYQNHIAVHTMGRALNSPHSTARIAGTSRTPFLADGNRHCVKIRYQPWIDNDALSDISYSASAYAAKFLQLGSGQLQVWVDDFTRPVLTVPVNVNATLGLEQGMAWVGFTASTGAAVQDHYIYSWSFTDTVCPMDCNERGTCIDASCNCEIGFYGDSCAYVVPPLVRNEETLCFTLQVGENPSTSIPDCLCAAGFQGPVGGPCYPCPLDFYKPVTGPSPCIPCPPNTDTLGKAGMKERTDCKCKAGYIGPDGGTCRSVPEDTYKYKPGDYINSTVACPINSGTGYKLARTSEFDCLCKPGYSGPNGGPCSPCPSESWKASWGDAECLSECPPNSITFACQGSGGNTACVSYYQCVCASGYYGVPCLPASPQAQGNKTCAPCVQSKFGPVLKSFQDDQLQNFYIIRGADQREDPGFVPLTEEKNFSNFP